MNTLYPIFLKTEQLEVLIVGGGYVALEKLQFMFKSAPQARVTLVSPMLRTETKKFIQDKNIRVINSRYPSALSPRLA